MRGTSRGRQETLEGREPKGATVEEFWLNPRSEIGIPEVSKALERRRNVGALRQNRMRVTAFREGVRHRGRRKPWRENPKSGTGMKQARQATRGARRRKGEKS
jgi:hypothetical protein